MDTQIVIMAAGRGKRMESDLPKAMHKIGDKTMLEMIMDNSMAVTSDIVLIYSDILAPYINGLNCKKALQEEPLGTGHAVACALSQIDKNKIVIVLCGDNPFIGPDIMENMLSDFDHDILIMAFNRANPRGYGRIILDDKGYVEKIIECKQTNDEQQKISLCNSGIMIFAPGVLHKMLPELMNDDKSGEYYLTNLVGLAYDAGLKTGYFLTSNETVIGVNTKEELAMANEYYEKSIIY